MEDHWLSVEKIEEYVEFKRDDVYMCVKSKNMPAHKMGQLCKFEIEALDKWRHQKQASSELKNV